MQGQLLIDSNISTEEALRLIDEAIAEHQASIAALKSQRNNFAHVSRLPSEILCRVFLHTQRDCVGEILPYLKWISLTYVSRHWRQVAINSSILWIEPSLENPQWLEEALRRSKDASLKITGFGSDELPGLTLALQHSSRIKDLSILDVSNLNAWNKVQGLLPQSASRLESLYLEGTGTPQRYLTASGNIQWLDPISVSEKVLCDTKRLRNLSLNGCNIDWDAHPLLRCSLTHLSLYQLAKSSRPTEKQFVDALKASPDLEHLELVDALPDEQSSWFRTVDHVYLTRLQTLWIRSNKIQEVEAFFRYFTFPPAATVKVECSSKQSLTIDFSGIITGLGRSYSTTLSVARFQTLFWNQDNTTSRVKLFADVLENKAMIYPFKVRPTLDLEFTWEKRASDSGQVITDRINSIFNVGAIPLQDVRSIYLNQHEIDSKMLANTFGRLPLVHFIMTRKHTSRPFIDALKLDANIDNTGSVGPHETTYFPALSSICLFDTRITHSKFENTPNSIAVPIELLQDCFSYRQKRGAEIEKLTLIQCRGLGRNETTNLLKTIAPVVDLSWAKTMMFKFPQRLGSVLALDSDSDSREEAAQEI